MRRPTSPHGLRVGGLAKRPVYFGAAGRSLFGFYHSPAEGPWRGAGVVLVPPIGTDHARSERTYRHLAERLAGAGFAVLRFDLTGIGDSGGDERSPHLLPSWIADVGLAAAELRSLSGAAHISLLGLRIGATLAALSAAAQAVDSLVLWSPCVSGAGYVGEVTRLHKLYQRMEPQLAAAPPAPADGQEALGMFLPQPLITALEGVKLLEAAVPRAKRVLVIDGGHGPGCADLVGRFQSQGLAVDAQSHPGHKFLVTVTQTARLPEPVLEAIVGWLSAGHASDVPQAALPAVDDGEGPHNERALVTRASVFGIWTPAAAARATPGRPAVILLNAGCLTRVGPHRASVRMARRFASLGFDVLRFDLPGIGDSPPEAGVAENMVYPPRVVEHLERLLAELQIERAILVGHCSGGDHAFAAGVAELKGLVGNWLLNPRTFCVLDLAAVESVERGAPPTTPVSEVSRNLRRMAERGVRTLLVVSRNDPGVAYVDAHDSTGMASLSGVAGFRRVEVEGADHTFTPVGVQAQVSDLLAAELGTF